MRSLAVLSLLALTSCATVPLGDMRLKAVVVSTPSLCAAQDRYLAGTATSADLAVISLWDLSRLKLEQYFARLTGQAATILNDCDQS